MTPRSQTMSVAEKLKKIIRDEAKDNEQIAGSVRIQDNEVIRKFIEIPQNTFLVSFPRTGSHWLRALMELYFEQPSLVRVFYYPEKTNYLSYHTHDLNLDIEHPTVLYLYRDPVDTIYSQLSYNKEGLNDADRIGYWSDLYGRHLDKWLHTEKFTEKKTVLRYERLKSHLPSEFVKVTQHFGIELDGQKLLKIAAATTKEEIKRKTTHDQQVINLNKEYGMKREDFYRQSADLVWDFLLKGRPHLKEDFQD
jgi:hypothetical protein